MNPDTPPPLTGDGPRGIAEPWNSPLLGHLQSRVVMSAMTRSAAGPDHVPTAAMATYYARRAEAGVGLVLTESTAIAPIGDGFPDAPRIVTEAQIEGWRTVTEAVHRAGAPIFCQLLHAGRITHPDYTDGFLPVSSTDRPAGGINRRNNQPYATPRRLDESELPEVVDLFQVAAAAADLAGFDGVELHLAHGYLPDQFLDGRVNDRTDRHGGSVENRCRFAVALVRSVVQQLGPERVIARMSPSRWMDGLYDWPDLDDMIAHLLPALETAGLRMLDISCARSDYAATSGRIVRMARPLWPHLLMAGASLSQDDAQAEIDAGLVDMVTYGRPLLANHDLVRRFRDRLPVTEFEPRMLDTLE